MKKLVMYLIVLFVCSVWGIHAQIPSANSQLETAIALLDSAKSKTDMEQVRNRFERLRMVDAEAWLPCYYQAYTDIVLSFREETPERKLSYLEEARTCLDRLKRMKLMDMSARSEISTLSGYWYFAQMALNPAVNGPKYVGVITACYQEALKMNPENPRAIFLNAYFQKSMATFMNQTYASFEEDMQKARTLLNTQSQQTLYPHWGITFEI